MIPISENAVAIESVDDFPLAFTMAGVTHIYLANTITLTGGITIPPERELLVFDGEYPLDSGNRNELIDMISSQAAQTLGIRSSSAINLTFRNMIISGRNYYGVPYIVESGLLVNTDAVTVTYENVTYHGRQITHNPSGMTRYIDCDITIEAMSGLASEEVGEVNRVELGGTTNILHTSLHNGDDFAVFWFRGTTSTMSLTVLEEAQVRIRSENCYFMFNVDATWATPHPLPITIRRGASLTLEMNLGISYSSIHRVTNFTVGENAVFRYIQAASNGSAASLYLTGTLTVQSGSQFHMQAVNGTQPLVQFIDAAITSLMVELPLSFVLYNTGNAVLRTAATTNFVLEGGQVNVWNTPTTPISDAGGFEDRPTSKWHKLAYAQDLALIGAFTPTATTVTNHNLEPEDVPYPDLLDLNMHSARVLSIGDWPVSLGQVNDTGGPVNGTTVPGANIRIYYTIDGTQHMLEAVAEGDGSFSIETTGEDPSNIPAGTVVEVWSNVPFLIKDTAVTSVHVGALSITRAPELIEFRLPPISVDPVLLTRKDPEVPVVIEDDRDVRTGWTLRATITGPLQTEAGDLLPDGIVFVEAAGAAPLTLGETPVVVYSGGPGAGPTSVFWSENAGILVRVTVPIRMGARYYSRVIWEVVADETE